MDHARKKKLKVGHSSREVDVGAGINRREMVASTVTSLALLGAGAVSSSGRSGKKNGAVSGRHRITPVDLRCEHLVEPLGVDNHHPRLAWHFPPTQASGRNAPITSWHVQVATAVSRFSRPDLWDSGWRTGSEMATLYEGRPLETLQTCFWRVRGRDAEGTLHPWSRPASWTTGFFSRSDWKAKWITDALISEPENFPRVPIHCYRSQIAHRPDQEKWIEVDLGREVNIDAIRLVPSRPAFLPPDYRSFLYPVRFYVEALDQNHNLVRRIVDQTHADVPSPRPPIMKPTLYRFPPTRARLVRIVVTQLAHWDCDYWAFSLGGIEIFRGKKNVALGAAVRCLDSVETGDISRHYLTKPGNKVSFHPYPPGIKPRPEDFLASPECWNILPPQKLLVDVPGVPEGHTVLRVPMLRREFDIPGPIRRAWLLITARGFHETYINGQRVSESRLAPGFTQFNKRVLYDMHDVTDLLHPGRNGIAALLAYGWYSGHMNLYNMCYIFGNVPKLLAQLEIELADGRRLRVVSDEQWRSSLDGPIRYSDLLGGECQDLRRSDPGWTKAGFDDSTWKYVRGIDLSVDNAEISWHLCQSALKQPGLRAKRRLALADGTWLFDFGQEIAGHCRLTTAGSSGTHITLHHAECLTPDGAIDRANLWDALQRDDVYLKGGESETFQPQFTYHGFRYVVASGLPRPPVADTLVAVPVRTDVRTVGEFRCSNPLWNKLMEAVRWTQWNLLFDVPAGCAARAERLAWMGDIRDCVPTALMNMDTAAFFSKYLQDARDSQLSTGQFCDITPHAQLRGSSICAGSPGWADAGVTMAWDLYMATGDAMLLDRHFTAMTRWVDFVHQHNPDLLWLNQLGMNWGDWMGPGSPVTPKVLAATAYFAHSADLTGKAAAILGRRLDAEKYHELYRGICRAFVRRWVKADGAIDGDAQGSYALALQFELLPADLIAPAMDHLKGAIRRNHGHLTTGYLSTRALVQALSRFGGHEVASRMINQVTRPSWGYMVNTIGTTFWESFDAYIKGQVVTLSLCHWAWSSIGEWFWRYVAGISPVEQRPGWREFLVEPRPTPEVRWCEAQYQSPAGQIDLKWQAKGKELAVQLGVPLNATAVVKLPVHHNSRLILNGRPMSAETVNKMASYNGGAGGIRLAGGRYTISFLER